MTRLGYLEAMRDIDLFQLALGLSSPWSVRRCEFDAEGKRLDIHIDFPRGSRFVCSGCGEGGRPAHDTKEETWRHLDFFQHKAFLHARVPRADCPACGVLKVNVPWARAGSGFTLLFEGVLMSMAKSMPVQNIARLIGEHDTRVWRVIQHYVDKAVDAKDLSKVRKIAVDETSARRGHDYVTLFADAVSRRVVHVADGKSGETIGDFVRRLEKQGGDKRNITDASIDMSAAFIAGVRENLPNARVTFDRFHVVKLVNEAVDEVRRLESRRDPLLKGARYIWLKNAENLTKDQAGQLAALEGANLDTMQAYQIRMNLQQVFRMDARSARNFLGKWNSWVKISGLAPMVKAAKTIMDKADDILRAIETGMSNGFLEAVNGRVQAAKRMARGYRTKQNLKTIIYLVAGGILGALPT